MLAYHPAILAPAGWLDSPELGPGALLARDFRASILAPLCRRPARRPVAAPEMRRWLMEATDGDPASLDAFVPPSLLADVAVEIIRRGPCPGPVSIDVAVDGRFFRADALRRRYLARLAYSAEHRRLQIAAGWRGWRWKVAYASVPPASKADQGDGKATLAALQAALDDFAAMAAGLTY